MSGIDPSGQLLAVGERLAAAGLVRESEGNLSIRLDDSRCLLTATGTDLGCLDPLELVEVGAVVHAHPPRLLRLDAEGKLPVWRRLEDRGRLLGVVVAVPYHAEGTVALAQVTADALRTAKACVLREHGAVTVGPTLMAAFVRMLDLERAASLTGTRG
jgi:L-fuculose-phosphate aldolase